jgi:hypothetical protein
MSTKAEEIEEKLRAVERETLELVQQAGIAEEAERAVSPHTPLHWDSDAASGSEQDQRETVEYWEDQRRTTARLLREAVFSVSNVGMRIRLIAKEREIEELRRDLFVQLSHDADATLEEARIPRPTWWIAAAVVGTMLVAVGYLFFGIPGALGGAVTGFFLGRYLEELSKADHNARIRRAENDQKEAKATKTEILNRPQIFSREEEKTGEPDPGCLS